MKLDLISPRELCVSLIYDLIQPRVVERISNIDLFLRSFLKKKFGISIIKHYIFDLDFNCTYHPQSTPHAPTNTPLSTFLLLIEAVLEDLFRYPFRFIGKFSHTSSMVSNLRPFTVNFSLGNKKKSAGAKSD